MKKFKELQILKQRIIEKAKMKGETLYYNDKQVTFWKVEKTDIQSEFEKVMEEIDLLEAGKSKNYLTKNFKSFINSFIFLRSCCKKFF